MKRTLTEDELENILDFIKPNKSLPPETADSIVNAHKERFLKQLRKQEIYPSLIPELKKQLHKNYIECMMEPGESVGILAAMAIGEKQTQSSCVYAVEVLVKKNGKFLKTPIGKLIDEEMESGKVIDIGNESYVKPLETNDIQVLTVSQEEKIEWKSVTELSRHLPHGDLVKVVTESGRSVVTTLSHSHLKKVENGIDPVLGSELKIGDRIPVIKKSPNESTNVDHLTITKYMSYVKTSDQNSEIQGDIFLCANFHEKRIPSEVYNSIDFIKIRLIKTFIQLRGYFDNSKEVLKDYQMLLTKFGILTHIKSYNMFIQKKYEKLLENLISEKVPGEMVSENFEELSEVIEKDVIWDKIINLEIIKEKYYKDKYVYDFSVEGNETFALYSGIVIHNTLNTLKIG
jgi:hypothetical protein